MEKLIQSTVESLTTQKEDKKYHCEVCRKAYTTEKMCHKHITENHQDHPDFINRMVDLKAERTAQDIKFAKDCILDFFIRNEEDWAKKRKEFVDRFSTDDIVHTLAWYSEDIVKQEKKYELMSFVKNIFYEVIGVDWDRKNVEEFVSRIKLMIEDIRNDLINNPYRHSSTGLMHNAIEEWQAYASAYVIRDTSYDNLNILIYYVNKLLENI